MVWNMNNEQWTSIWRRKWDIAEDMAQNTNMILVLHLLRLKLVAGHQLPSQAVASCTTGHLAQLLSDGTHFPSLRTSQSLRSVSQNTWEIQIFRRINIFQAILPRIWSWAPEVGGRDFRSSQRNPHGPRPWESVCILGPSQVWPVPALQAKQCTPCTAASSKQHGVASCIINFEAIINYVCLMFGWK